MLAVDRDCQEWRTWIHEAGRLEGVADRLARQADQTDAGDAELAQLYRHQAALARHWSRYARRRHDALKPESTAGEAGR